MTGSNLRNGTIYCWSNNSSTSTTVEKSQFTFRQYISNSNSTTMTTNYKNFDLPATLPGDSTATYSILTTKNTVTVGQGGTGITSNPSMLINLGSTTAASVFAPSPRPGVTGILRVENGGAGQNSLADLKSVLGVLDVVYSSTQPTYVAGRIWLKPA